MSLTGPRDGLKAENVVRKHRLAERLLTDIIGLPWAQLPRPRPCRWEHVISDEVEARLVELLGHPTTCPHGNPIPGAAPVTEALTALGGAGPGEQVTLRRVTEQVEIDTDALEYLSTHGFVPGAVATVTARAEDGTLTMNLAGHCFALAPGLTRLLYVAAA